MWINGHQYHLTDVHHNKHILCDLMHKFIGPMLKQVFCKHQNCAVFLIQPWVSIVTFHVFNVILNWVLPISKCLYSNSSKFYNFKNLKPNSKIGVNFMYILHIPQCQRLYKYKILQQIKPRYIQVQKLTTKQNHR